MELSGEKKTAIVLLSLSEEQAGEIMRRLPEEVLARVTQEMPQMQSVSPEVRRKVLEEFQQQLASKPEDLEQAEEQSHFSALGRTKIGDLLSFIRDEHPQTIALVLAHLAPQMASVILQGLSGEKQVEVIKRVASMDEISEEVLQQVEQGLELRLAALVDEPVQPVAGMDRAAEILALAEPATGQAIIEQLEEEDPELMQELRGAMFEFEDIASMDDDSIQLLLKALEFEELMLALQTASDKLKGKIFDNLPKQQVKRLKNRMQEMGPVRISDVEGAQRRIGETARRLEDETRPDDPWYGRNQCRW